MTDLRIRELERQAATGDEEAVGRLRSWKARQGNCEHAFYVKGVEKSMPLQPHHPSPQLNMSRGYKARVRCEFCSFRREPVLQYNPLNELHRLRIELEANGKLSFVIDTDVTSCFRLGFVRLGSDRWDPLGKSLVTNNDEWMHISRVILKGAHASLAVRVAAIRRPGECLGCGEAHPAARLTSGSRGR